MKHLLLIGLTIFSFSAMANKPGPQPGDACFCPTCRNNTKCANTLAEEDRKSGKEFVKAPANSNGRKSKQTSRE